MAQWRTIPSVRAGLQSGQLPAAGGAAASGAALDIDDVAGETDQDWCEGRASFPEDRLSDGGSGGAARVVPDDFGTDWTAEITSRSNRFTISWATNLSVVVEVATNLAHPTWVPLQTNALTNGTFNFSDPQWTNYR